MSLRKDNPSESRISLELLLRDDLFIFREKFETMKTVGKNRPVKPPFVQIDDFKTYFLKYSVKLLGESKKVQSFISNDNLTLSFNNSRRANSYRENMTNSNMNQSKPENMERQAIEEEDETESKKPSRKSSVAVRKEVISDGKSTPVKQDCRLKEELATPVKYSNLSVSKELAVSTLLS